MASTNKKIIPFGSCRIRNFFPSQVNDFDFTHSTKHILQLIKLIEKSRSCDIGAEYKLEYILFNRYWRTAKKFRKKLHFIRHKIDTHNVVVIEICSLKILQNQQSGVQYNLDNYAYLGNGYCSNRPSIVKLDKHANEIKQHTTLTNQTRADFFKDLEIIYGYFTKKGYQIVLVPHLNFQTSTGEYIKNRVQLCNWIGAFCAHNKNAHFFNPVYYVGDDTQPDMFHYTEPQIEIIKNAMGKFIKKIIL